MSKMLNQLKVVRLFIIIIIIMLLKYNTIKHCCADKTTYYLQLEAIGTCT